MQPSCHRYYFFSLFFTLVTYFDIEISVLLKLRMKDHFADGLLSNMIML